MPIFVNQYADPNQQVPTFKVHIEKKNDQDFVIIIDVLESGTQTQLTLSQASIWLKIESDYRVTVLTNAPTNVTPLAPDYANFDLSRIIVKSNEVFVAKYFTDQRDDSNRKKLTGHIFGTFDLLYVHIQRNQNTSTFYQPL